MIFRRTLMAAALVAGGLLASTGAMAQFAERTIKFTNGVNEDHPVVWASRKCRKCWPPRPAAR